MAGRKAATVGAAQGLPRAGLLRLLATLSVILAPHLPRLPLWAAGLVMAVVGWRALAAWRGWAMLPRLLRIGLALAAFAGIYQSFGRVSGQTAGVALLTVMAALKLTELNSRRDLMVMSFLMYFLLVTHFLFSQELWTAAYLIVCAVLITGVLMEANHPGGTLPSRLLLGRGSRMIGQALPLMVLIFVLFPRIPGPLWGLPSDSGAARSGLSDSMSPGDIAHLIQSDEIAFRVRFDGVVPPMRERYWRGPVLGSFVGGDVWRVGSRPDHLADPVAEPQGPPIGYELTLEANRTPWLLALDLPSRDSLPQDTRINADYQLVLAQGELRERRLLHLVSYPRSRLQAELPQALRERFLALPKIGNQRARALAARWRDEGLAPAALVDRALAMFRQEKFFYTLNPPTLRGNVVDGFLFDTRKGFCEHYAGSFTFLMRAAGVPARVVTGYQGGEKNDIGDYYVVRQSDAHAWSEVWLEGRGWVRVDPTSAVAPDRIERGLGDALAGTADLPAFLDPSRRGSLRFDLEARWDWANAQWNHWVLGYGPDVQRQFLALFGLGGWRDMILALTVAVGSVLGLFGLLVLRAAAPRRQRDEVLRAWQRLQARLAKRGLAPIASEGPRDYAERVAAARPELAAKVRALAARYQTLRYTGDDTAAQRRAFTRAVGAFRAR